MAALLFSTCATPLRDRCAALRRLRWRARSSARGVCALTASPDSPPPPPRPVPAAIAPGEVHLWWMDTRAPPVRARLACSSSGAHRVTLRRLHHAQEPRLLAAYRELLSPAELAAADAGTAVSTGVRTERLLSRALARITLARSACVSPAVRACLVWRNAATGHALTLAASSPPVRSRRCASGAMLTANPGCRRRCHRRLRHLHPCASA